MFQIRTFHIRIFSDITNGAKSSKKDELLGYWEENKKTQK